MTQFGLVIPTLNEGPMLAMTVDSVLAASDGAKVDVVVVDDGCTDGCIEPVARLRDGRVRIVEGGGLGVARARNFGAAHVDAEILVFLDAHCTVPAGWLHALATSLDDPSVGLLGPAFTRLTSPTPRGCGMRWAGFDLEPCWFTAPDTAGAYPAPLTIGACQAFRRETFEALGRYDEQFTRWGFEDVEICLRTWTAGLTVTAHPGITVGHHFREARDNYEVRDREVLYNFLRLVYLHFSPTLVRRVLDRFVGDPEFAEVQQALFDADIFAERRSNFARRHRDDRWFFTHVNGPLA